ncbi:MAG: glycosyl hydrolase family 28 protein [Armatimonadota bacterium]
MMNLYKLILALGCTFAVFTTIAVSEPADTAAQEPKLVVYPAPQGAELSKDYIVTVNGKKVDVYIAPVWEPPYGTPFGGPYSFAYFDFQGSAKVSVTTKKPLDKVKVLPASRRIKPKVSGETMTFKLTKPCQISIEPDAKNGPLLLFANPIEVNPPKKGDPGVRYFGPGIHDAGEIKLGDNETLYIAGGAVVRGGVKAQGSNITIRGRGIIDGGKWERFKGPTNNPLFAIDSNNLKVEGIILKDSWTWTCLFMGCRNVTVDNLKICSSRCENNDGIDIVNSQHVFITNSFIRSDDDSIAPKGMGAGNGMAVDDVKVTKCVLWTDRAHIWRVGCESRAESMRNMLFKDIDVIHFSNWEPWLISLQPAEDMPMENIRFENIRVNGEGQKHLIELMTEPTIWATKQTAGTIRNCSLKNIVVTGDSAGKMGLVSVRGSNPEHTIENVVFENIVRYGHKLAKDSPEVEINQFTKNITIK